MKIKLPLTLLMMFFVIGNLFAQTTVSGKVTDSETGEGIVGANVLVKGTGSGTVTDVDGNYSLTVPESATHLIFSFVGYTTEEVSLAGQTTLNVKLKVEAKALQELVVVGYGVQKKSDVTGSIASVSKEELKKSAVSGLDQALQGRAAGVSVTASNGAPGAGVQVRIRGLGTVNSADPLYVVDGFPIAGGAGYLNPDDIESVEILKDASASAIYGARAANGVVLITTKKGVAGKTSITYDAYYGVQSVWKKPSMLNGREWVEAMTEAKNNGIKNDPNEKPFALAAPADNAGVSTDWFDQITGSGVMQSHTVGVSGGSDLSKYYMSVGYFQQEGIIKNSGYDRLTARFNGDHKLSDKLTVGTNLSIRHSQTQSVPDDYYHGAINAALKLDPLTPAKDDQGVWVSSPYMDINNVVGTVERANSSSKILRISGNAFAEYEIIKGLKFKSNFGMDLFRNDSYDFSPKFNLSPDERNDRNSVYRGNSRTNNWLWENTLSYNRTFADKHNVSVLAGITRQEDRYENLDVTRFDTPDNSADFQYVSAGTDDKPQVSGSASEWAMLSYLGRLNYSYDNRYLLTASVRRDGSSKFSSKNRYGTFPSFSLGWRIMNESFMQGVGEGFLDDLKLRIGWGQIGNSEIPAYRYATSLGSNGEFRYIFGVGGDEKAWIGVGPTAFGNPSIKWEVVESTNIGLDAAFFNNRLTASVEYFIKNTKDMLLVQPVPNYVGYNSTTGGTLAPYANLGEISNKGIELSLNWRQDMGDFGYSIGANLTSIKNEVVSLGTGKLEFLAGGSFQAGATTRTAVGQPIGTFYGFVTDGLFQTQGEVDAWYQSGAVPGDFKFKDLNGDKVINDQDKQVIGSPMPDFTYGINLAANYKNFDISLFFQGVQGNSVFNAMKYFNMSGGFPYNKHQDVKKAWGRPGADNSVPILNSKDKNNNFRISDFYVEDGSYLRLKNLQIGYTLPESVLSKVKMERVRLYVSGQNLLTFTKYSGLDPEIGERAGTLSTGVDVGTYPQSRTLMIGANISF